MTSRTKSFSKVVTSLFITTAALVCTPSAALADDDACEGVAAKQRYTPSPEGLLALAQCHDQHGKTATAWVEYLEAAGVAHRTKHKDTEATANARATAIQSKLVKLAVTVQPGSDVDGLEVKRDGVIVERAAWGTAAPVDPGEHVIEASAPGKLLWKRVVNVKAGTETVAVGPLPELVATTTISSAPLSETVDAPVTVGRTQRITGIAIGAFGVAALAAGGYFGLKAISNREDAKNACPSSPCADKAGVDLNEKAKDQATVSSIALVGGGIAILTGTILYFTAPKQAQHVGIDAGPGYAGLTLRGSL